MSSRKANKWRFDVSISDGCYLGLDRLAIGRLYGGVVRFVESVAQYVSFADGHEFSKFELFVGRISRLKSRIFGGG